MAEELELIFDDKENLEKIHISILEECRNIKTPKEMEDYMLPVGAERFYPEPERVFHDSVPLPEEQLEKATEDARKQKAIVLSVFEHHQQLNFTAYEMWLILNEMGDEYRMLQNSVRRSITNLTKGNRLIKCQWSERRMGQYGKDTRTWRFNTEYVAPISLPDDYVSMKKVKVFQP